MNYTIENCYFDHEGDPNVKNCPVCKGKSCSGVENALKEESTKLKGSQDEEVSEGSNPSSKPTLQHD